MARVITHGPWIGDGLQQGTAKNAARQQIEAMPGFMGFTKSSSIAHREMDRLGGVVHTIMASTKGNGARYPVFGMVVPPGTARNAGSGSGGSGATVPGVVAANASLKQFTGGGTQNLGSTNIQNAGIAVLGEFLGANFQAIDTKVPEGMSPDCLNVDGMGMGGALSPRPGLIALWPKRHYTSNAVAATHYGRSFEILSPAVNQSNHMTVISGYDRSSNIGTSLSGTTIVRVKRMKPLWHPQHDISQVAPKIRLTSSTATGSVGPTLNISMPQKYRKLAPQVASVDQIIVRVSRITYPRDRDGKDDTQSIPFASIDGTSLDYRAYDGTSSARSDATSMSSTGATNFYSAWCVSKLGVTQRASIKVVVK